MTVIVLTTGTSWTVPSDFSSTNTIEVWGGGAGGAAFNFSSIKGGSGGGAYSAISNITLTPSSSIAIIIGAGGLSETNSRNPTSGGDTWFNGASLAASSVGAKGGSVGSGNVGGAGGAAASGIGTTKNSGGAGGSGSGTTSGPGGGGSAGASGNGTAGGNSSSTIGGVGGASGGGVASGGTAGNTTTNAGAGGSDQTGGGGGGGGNDSGAHATPGGAGGFPGGAGGNASGDTGTGTGGVGSGGQIVITYTPTASSITLSSTLQEANDTFAATVNSIFTTASAALQENTDIFAATVTSLFHTVSAALQEANDTFAATAHFGAGTSITLSAALQEANDSMAGNVSILSGGNLQFVYTENSTSQGTVHAFSDGVINITSVTVNGDYPIVKACIAILNQVGGGIIARPYKLDVIKNNVKLFTVRSVYWGSQHNLGVYPNYILIDRQTQGGSAEVA